MSPAPAWFRSLVGLELFFQLPFFVIALCALTYRGGADSGAKATSFLSPDKFRSLCMIYGASTSTTLVPILATVVMDDKITASEKSMLFAFYMPYFVFPFWLMLLAARSTSDVFG